MADQELAHVALSTIPHFLNPNEGYKAYLTESSGCD
jgi:hypothetical protein